MDGIHCSQFIFYNDFDSANLLKVEPIPTINESAIIRQQSSTSKTKIDLVEIPDNEFNLWTKPDCYGTEFENGNRTWFYFGIKAPKSGLLIKFNLVNLNKQSKMYSQGMAPVYRIIPNKLKWERIQDKPLYTLNNDIFNLSFKYRSPESAPDSCTYFAFTYPFSFNELNKMLINIDTKYLSIHPIGEDDIYYLRETACLSLQGRNIDLITISSYHGITMEREERLKNLFPQKNVSRPYKFIGKKVIFISARVHPGETPSSYVFNGILNFLLNRDDLQAQTLRKLYVFKLIPFLNPDGVANGHYRTDTRGVNLNRVYLNPSLKEHPSVYAARALIRYYHYGFEKEDKIVRCDSCQKNPSTSNYLTHANESDNLKKLSHMSLNEEQQQSVESNLSWCTKSAKINLLDSTLGHNFCRQCGCKLLPTESKEEIKFENLTVDNNNKNHGDVNSNNESGLFMYLDLHGHASKKGIFLYGNHFDDLERRVECMLLPKLMGLNNHHFHFQGCNFTERNMYLKDKRDGMSRAGSGRVAVLSLTGIIKSYTLECNYNTGRLVNILPPTIKESSGKVHTLPVPPKYTPQIFEEVGRSIGSSILDLTGQNPFSRLPNSEFHNLTGLREWLRTSCCSNNFGDSRPKMSRLLRVSSNNNSPQTQAMIRTRCGGHPQRHTIGRTTTTTATAIKRNIKQLNNKTNNVVVQVERKENLLLQQQQQQQQQSGSKSCCINKMPKSFIKAKSRKDLTLIKTKNNASLSEERLNKTKKLPLASASSIIAKSVVEHTTAINHNNELDQTNINSPLHLREICFIKNTEGKTMIAKYKNKESEEFDDNLVVSWDAPTSKATVFTHKSRVVAASTSHFIQHKSPSEPGTSKQLSDQQQNLFRVHNFAKNHLLKSKFKRQTLRRLVSATELGKLDRKKNKKKLRVK